MVVYICIYSSDGTFVEKSHFWDKTFRLFIGKVSQKHPDYSLFTQDFPQCDFCGIGWRFFNLTYTFWMLFFVDVLPWLNVRVHSIRSDSVVLLSPKAEARQVFLRYAVLSKRIKRANLTLLDFLQRRKWHSSSICKTLLGDILSQPDSF